MKYAIVCNNSGPRWEFHKAGCADLKKLEKQQDFAELVDSVEEAEAVVVAAYGDEYTLAECGEFKKMSCAK